jgi:hypothetical protein
MINIPVFKKHHRAGISLTSKNHFGSIAPYTGGAWHLHPSLPLPEANGDDPNVDDLATLDYGVYRCLVDIMGHKDLGGKTILYLVDGLWSSTNWGHPPIKWIMQPFNIDWPNSLFLSQDPVAIQSVCYDFLFEEFDADHPTEGLDVLDGDRGPFSRFPAADDFLHQAASPANWPAGIEYDPENDGTVLGSLGVHEHWNNATQKLYSRNLGADHGIQLISDHVLSINDHVNYIPKGFELSQNYPNPFSESTTLRYTLAVPSQVQILIYNTAGEQVFSKSITERSSGICEFTWNGTSVNGERVPQGQYIVNLHVNSDRGSFDMSNKLVIAR